METSGETEKKILHLTRIVPMLSFMRGRATPGRGNGNPLRGNATMATYPAYGRQAGFGEMIIPDSDGTAKTLLDQIQYILEGHGEFDYDSETGELIIRTGLDIQMGGDLVPLDREDDD